LSETSRIIQLGDDRPKILRKDSLMKDTSQIRVEIVESWEECAIVDLYRAGGWWKESMDSTRIGELIKGSLFFAVAIDTPIGKTVGMGRVISDGIADAYVQDLVVLEGWKEIGVGRMILSVLLEKCRSLEISWIGLIAEPGTDSFYRSLGFMPMVGHMPMLFSPEMK
jgi:aralkylamine N-acetyltransferase